MGTDEPKRFKIAAVKLPKRDGAGAPSLRAVLKANKHTRKTIPTKKPIDIIEKRQKKVKRTIEKKKRVVNKHEEQVGIDQSERILRSRELKGVAAFLETFIKANK